MSIQRSLVRLAVAIHGQLAGPRCTNRLPDLPAEDWRRSQAVLGRLRRAELHGWHLAAESLRRDLLYEVGSIASRLADLGTELPFRPRQLFTTPSEIYHDLVELQRDFEQMSFSQSQSTLNVTTEPIELEDIWLGPFEICLNWRLLSGQSRYRVVALEPNPAASRPEVTHPHVRDEALCEGEGHVPIRQALAEGRLLDFFTLVAGTLRHYNESSPFVELAVWKGRSCSDCGYLVDEDDAFACPRCGESVCEECVASCGGCGDAHCPRCLEECAICSDPVCPGCLGSCARCARRACEGCLSNPARCEHCHDESDSNSCESRPSIYQPAVHAHGLGQAALPA